MQIQRLMFIYDADRGFVGHLKYALRLLAGDHCGLCDITHGGLSEKGSWQRCKVDLEVPSDTIYRDEMSEEVAAVVAGDLPTVVAQTDGGLVKLFGRDVLDACAGDVEALKERLDQALSEEGLALTA